VRTTKKGKKRRRKHKQRGKKDEYAKMENAKKRAVEG
jgi:hypothetical protein